MTAALIVLVVGCILGSAVAINFWLLETKPYDRWQQDRPARDRE